MKEINRYIPLMVEYGLSDKPDMLLKAVKDLIRILSQSRSAEEQQLSKSLNGILINHFSQRNGEKKGQILRKNNQMNSTDVSPETYKIDFKPQLSDELIVDYQTNKEIERFIRSYELREDFLSLGIKNLNTLFLSGPPGVGKTTLAKYIAQKTGLPLMTVNLANLISRYLGNTGKNIAEVIDYASKHNVVLFFDEFDSIARNRLDENESGELRRIVNVLLTEIENWNNDGLLISATNLTETIDPAIMRRFGNRITIHNPGIRERYRLWESLLSKSPEITSIPKEILNFLSENSKGVSPSEIKRIVDNSFRNSIIDNQPIVISLLTCFFNSGYMVVNKKNIGENVHLIKKVIPSISQRELADIFEVSKSTIQRKQNIFND